MKAWVLFTNAAYKPEQINNMPCNEIFVSRNEPLMLTIEYFVAPCSPYDLPGWSKFIASIYSLLSSRVGSSEIGCLGEAASSGALSRTSRQFCSSS